MSKDVLVFVRVENASEPGTYIVQGVEEFQLQNLGDEGDNDDVVVRITAKVDDKDLSMTAQTVGRWVQNSTDVDLNAAKHFLQQNHSTALPVVNLFRKAQLTGANKISGLEPTRPVNPLPQRMLPEKLANPRQSYSLTHKRKLSNLEASESGSDSSSKNSDSSFDAKVYIQLSIIRLYAACTGARVEARCSCVCCMYWFSCRDQVQSCVLHVLVFKSIKCVCKTNLCAAWTCAPPHSSYNVVRVWTGAQSRDQLQCCVMYVGTHNYVLILRLVSTLVQTRQPSNIAVIDMSACRQGSRSRVGEMG